MKKITAVFFLLGCFLSSTAQTKPDSTVENEPDSTYHFPCLPQVFYLESNKPFFTWAEKPVTFSFRLYNRWGEIMAESTDPYFIIDNALKKGIKLKEDTYVYKVVYTTADGEKKEIIGHRIYMGYYCAG